MTQWYLMQHLINARPKMAGAILKELVEHLLYAMVKVKLQPIVTILLTTAVSLADRRFTVARWDGEDWEFRWSDGCLFWHSPIVRPKRVTTSLLSLYLTHYSPRPGDTILEVGAGNGTEVCTLSNMVGSAGQIFAIEAEPTTVRRLKKQASSLRNKNVQVLGCAVGAKEGRVQLGVAEPGGLQNSIVATVGPSRVTVECKTLGNLIAELGIDEISYMKMNIEGAEYDALLGLGASITRIKEMCISCHDFTGDPAQATYTQVREYLISKGMQIATLPPNDDAPWEQYHIFANWGTGR